MEKCISCGANISNDNEAANFPCPNCKKEQIVRCGACRKQGVVYKCKCEFEGP